MTDFDFFLASSPVGLQLLFLKESADLREDLSVVLLPTESTLLMLPLELDLTPEEVECFRAEPGLGVFLVLSNIPELEELLGRVPLTLIAVPLGVFLVCGSPFFNAFFWILGEVDFGRGGNSGLEPGLDCPDLELERA